MLNLELITKEEHIKELQKENVELKKNIKALRNKNEVRIIIVILCRIHIAM